MTQTQTVQELLGHDSPETAYLVPDYPYSFTLRTEIRYWIETKRGHGQRVMSQTRNPKKPGQPWNKPKSSTYAPIKVLYLNTTNGHVENDGLSSYGDEAEIEAFRAKYPETCASERNLKVLEVMIARQRAYKRVTWTVTSVPSDGPRQSHEEQAAIMNKLTALELNKLRNGNSE